MHIIISVKPLAAMLQYIISLYVHMIVWIVSCIVHVVLFVYLLISPSLITLANKEK